jgi:ribosomal protein S14
MKKARLKAKQQEQQMKHESHSVKSLITCLNCGTWRGLEALNVSWNEFLAPVLNVYEWNAWMF